MLKRLPVFVDPIRYAEERKSLEGEISIADMERLKASLSRLEAQVKLQMRFGIDELKTKFIEGRMQTELSMICQRCLREMAIPIESSFLLGIVSDLKQADELALGYEPLVVTSKSVKLADIIEDELILALPIVPMHGDKECHAEKLEPTKDEIPENSGPFSQLKNFTKVKS